MSAPVRKSIDIVLPPRLREVSAGSLALCELLVSRLLSSDVERVSISVDIEALHVEGNEKGVKDAVTLMLRSGRIEEFYKQFIELLHEPESAGGPRFLRCIVENRELAFEIEERAPLPNFAWRIRRR